MLVLVCASTKHEKLCPIWWERGGCGGKNWIMWTLMYQKLSIRPWTSQDDKAKHQQGNCLFQHHRHSQYTTVTPMGWHSSALMGDNTDCSMGVNMELCHLMWDCYPVHMLKEEELYKLWVPRSSLSFPTGSSGLGKPLAPHWRGLLWIVPALELLTSETDFLCSLGSNGQQPFAVFHALFFSWPLDPTNTN